MQNPVDEERRTAPLAPRTPDGTLPFNLTPPSPMRARSLLHSFRFALEGIAYAFRTQRNFKIHSAITAVVIVAGITLRLTLGQWEALAVVIGLVFQTELTNTAVEAIVDRVSPEFHELAKVAKDCSAAAVLVTAISAVIVGALIFGPHVLALIEGFAP